MSDALLAPSHRNSPGARRVASAIACLALAFGFTGANSQSTGKAARNPAALTGTTQLPATGAELQLYGVTLRNSPVEGFISAAKAAGGRVGDSGPDGSVALDVRAAGVPALQRLVVKAEGATFVSAQFVVKSYGEDNEALRRALVDKYGLPSTADGARRPFPSFAARFAPRGSFDWDFAGGMKLIYRQPALGDTTLSYIDAERARRLDAIKGTSPERGTMVAPPAHDNRF
jgi:hypothetical protein